MRTKPGLRFFHIFPILLVAGCAQIATTTRSDDTSDTMVLIPAGPFLMGNCVTGLVRGYNGQPKLEGDENELPVHEVKISAFCMDKYKVTKELWDEVYAWAIANGYDFDNPGEGRGPDYPVCAVSWYDCVKWCNARSERDNRTPCYYVDAEKTEVYRTGRINIRNNFVNWTADGYRLPTEAEWEKAARGGKVGYRFPWGNTISHNDANYNSRPGNPGESDSIRLFPVDMYHPKFYSRQGDCTSPVGYFRPNGYGLYDMAGNTYEWCWDWHNKSYYAKSPTSDPKGPQRGKQRVARGGSWCHSAFFLRCSYRACRASPDESETAGFGFRCVRRSDEQSVPKAGSATNRTD